MAGRLSQEGDSNALPVETLPLAEQVFTIFQAKESIKKKKHEFANSNIVIQLERVQILISIVKYAEKKTVCSSMYICLQRLKVNAFVSLLLFSITSQCHNSLFDRCI